MSYVMNVVFKAKDEVSSYLKNIGDNGSRVIAGLEDEFLKVNSAANQTGGSISDFSARLSFVTDEYAAVTSGTNQFTSAVLSESEAIRKNAQSLQLKADNAERAAAAARSHYEEILTQTETEGEASDALKSSAEQALKEASTLEKAAEAWRKKADAAEQSYFAVSDNTQTISGMTSAEEKAAEAISKTGEAMSGSAKKADEAASSISRLSSSESDIVSQSRLLSNAMTAEAERMERAAEKARQKADGDSRAAEAAKEFYESLKRQTMESDNVTEALKEQTAQALKVSEALDKAAKKSEQKANAMEKSAAAAKENASAAEKSARAEEQIYNSADKMLSAESEIVGFFNNAESEAENYARAATKAADESERLGTSGESAAQLLESAFMALGVERALSKIADGFISCSKSAIEFESAMAGVYKTVDGTEEQLAKISGGIKSMALEIPSSTTEIAGVAESAGQLGIAADDITDFTRVMIDLGETTNLTSEEAASSLAKFSNITGMSASSYENLGSSVVALGNNFATTEADIVAMSTRMASAGTLAGLTESDILGLAAAMSSVGIEADAGGSAMSKLLSDIQVAVETGNGSLTDFASVAGMTVEQFSDLFENRAVEALSAFITGLNDVERNGRTATVILENMGITEVRMSNAVKSLASSSGGMTDAIRLAGDAWQENTALAKEAETRYGTLESRLTVTRNAADGLKVAIGNSLNPVVGELADAGTKAMVWLTGFCDEHQMLVTAAAGTVTALGLLAGSVTAYTVATKAADAVSKAFDTTLSKSKIGLIIGITAAAGAAIGSIAYAFSSVEDEVEDYNGTLEQCRNEIDSTAMAYENVCKMYGENHEAAQNLKTELDMLNAQYQKGGGFAEDYAQRLSESKEAFASFKSEYNEKISVVDDSRQSGMVAVAQLDALSEKAQITNSDLDMMSKYADYLNDTFNCNIEVDYDTGELTGFDPNNVNDEIIRKSDENRKQAALDQIANVEMQQEYMDAIKYAYDQEQKIKEIRDEIYKGANDPSYVNTTGYDLHDIDEGGALYENLKNTRKEIQDTKNSYIELYQKAGLTDKDAETLLSHLEKSSLGFNDLKDSAEEAIEVITPEQAVSDAWKAQEEEINELAQAYDEAYDSIRTDLDGMFGLFEEASMNMENTLSFDGAIDNLESQIDYFNQYENALTELSGMGIDNNILDRLDPKQAVAFADELSKLDPSEAAEKILKLNDSFEKLSDSKDAVAEKMLSVEDEFNERLDDIRNGLEESVKGMELEDEAAKSAMLTMNGYINQLRLSGGRAESEAQGIASRVSAALNGGSISSSAANVASAILGLKGYASGTSYAEPGLKLVGENGPELISFRGGERVYNADETESMIRDYADKPLYIPPVKSEITRQIERVSETKSTKELNVNINGSGSVRVTGGMSKEDVLEVMYDYFKPVIASIVEQDEFEEGDRSYDY